MFTKALRLPERGISAGFDDTAQKRSLRRAGQIDQSILARAFRRELRE
jgi:hypothetical protein